MEESIVESLPAVTLERVSKHFRLYREKNDSLKATITRGKRARYAEFPVLSDINLNFFPGATVGIIGSNGSGKSTLLKIIANVLSPDSGDIITRGRLIALLELGAGFHPELTGRENIFLNAAILGISQSRIKDEITEIISFAELEEFIDIAIKHYSSGMVVRLGFAIAAHVDPEILVVDEVLSVGDASFQRKSLGKIKEFRDAGKTVIIVSHDLGVLKDTCERVIWLEGGRVRDDGMAEVILERYLSHESERGEVSTNPDFSPSKLIEQVALSDGQSNNTGIFERDTPIRLSMIISNYQNYESISVIICIKNEDNRIVWQNHESVCRIETKNLQVDTLSVFCDIEAFPFAEGIFTVGIQVVDSKSARLIEEWPRPIKINIVRGGSPDYGFSALKVNFSLQDNYQS